MKRKYNANDDYIKSYQVAREHGYSHEEAERIMPELARQLKKKRGFM